MSEDSFLPSNKTAFAAKQSKSESKSASKTKAQSKAKRPSSPAPEAPPQTIENFLEELCDGVELITEAMMKLQNEKVNMDSSQIQDTVYVAYSEALNLIADCKALTQNLRKSYKVKEASVKKWMASDSDDDSSSDGEDEQRGNNTSPGKDNTADSRIKVTNPTDNPVECEVSIVNPLDTTECKHAAPAKPKRGRPPGKKASKAQVPVKVTAVTTA